MKTRVAPEPLREKEMGERAAVEMKNGAPARKLARRRALARSRIFVRVSKMRFGFVGAEGVVSARVSLCIGRKIWADARAENFGREIWQD